jgi:hypothetical protein
MNISEQVNGRGFSNASESNSSLSAGEVDQANTDLNISGSQKNRHDAAWMKIEEYSTATDKIYNVLSFEEMLSASPTTEEKLCKSLTTEEMLSGVTDRTDRLSNTGTCSISEINFSDDFTCDKSLYVNDKENVHLGHVNVKYTKPNYNDSSEKMKVGGSAGLSGELTLFDGNPELSIGKIGEVDARFRLGTVNANANIEGQIKWDLLKPKELGASLKGSLGAETLMGDTRYNMDISITPKSVGDTLGGIYNKYIDPIVDYVSNQDVPGIPEIPDEYDHGISASGHFSTGFGASAKLGGELEVGNGKGFKVGVKGKAGLGPVAGAGFTLGVK